MSIMRGVVGVFFAMILSLPVFAQANDEEDSSPLSSSNFEAFNLRNIGPAFMSGRIADIIIVPDDPATWYVAVGSGGVWKTENAGTTWTSLFDGQGSYSIGSLGADPSDPNRIWVGTGENHGGRHNGFGDGIYVSDDGGASWEKKGLDASEHISKIIVHPEDPNTVWVASQGPLWSPGGENAVSTRRPMAARPGAMSCLQANIPAPQTSSSIRAILIVCMRLCGSTIGPSRLILAEVRKAVFGNPKMAARPGAN